MGAPLDSSAEELALAGAILVEDRVLRRVIKRHRRIRGLAVPHEHCYVLPREELARYVDPDEVPDALLQSASLPARVILVRGDRAALAGGHPASGSGGGEPAPADARGSAERGAAAAWCAVWRRCFHASVHRVFDERLARGALTPAAIRERIHRIGQTEFDEIRSVLAQEDLLLPPVDAVSVYIEFAALYLELRYFAPATVARTFPAVASFATVDATIALDLDPAALLAASRPARAPAEPVVERAPAEPTAPAARPPAPPRVVPGARWRAARARARGNHARAALLAARSGDRATAQADLDELTRRLARALAAPATEAVRWAAVLLPLVEHAGTSRSPRLGPGARLLHDLAAACVVAERETRVVDAIAWARSRGRVPIVRSLPATREARIAKHLRAATAKLAACGLAGQARDQLADALHAMVDRADAQVRAALRPRLEAALDEVGLAPRSLPERVAQRALVDELLDRAVAVGRLSLGDLRDALSRNDLKLPDLSREDLGRGDPLLRADRILAHSLDGVYRGGEAYMRALQRGSAVLFGTRVGRWITLYAMLPLLGSYTVIGGLHHMVAPLAKYLEWPEPEIATTTSILGGAAALFLLMHAPPARRATWWGARMLWRVLRALLVRVPLAIWHHPLVQALAASRLMRWGIKPGLPAAVVWWVVPGPWHWPAAAAVHVGIAAGLSSRLGRRIEEIAIDWLVRTSRHLTSRLVPALVKWTLQLFVQLVELLDRGIYRVDEWLRFRTGQSLIMIVLKGVFGAAWFFVTYLLRLYVNLFVEPTTNPIKHFPVVTVAAKIIVPYIPAMLSGIASATAPLLGAQLAGGFAAFTVLVLPGLAGFLVWELKENWRLYRATRPQALRPRLIGHHGETMARYLRPGFHSGTIPKLFTKLRRAAWKDDARAVARHKEALHHVEEAVERFIERQLVEVLNQSGAMAAAAAGSAATSAGPVACAGVEVGSNRVQIALTCERVAPQPATLRFELQSGWIVVGIPEPGWIDHLSEPARAVLEIALAGCYKLAAVDLVREQLERALEPQPAAAAPPYDIADEGLVVWPAQGFELELVYDLRDPHLRVTARGPAVDRAPEPAAPLAEPGREPAVPAAAAEPAAVAEPAAAAEPAAQAIDLAGRRALFGRELLYGSRWLSVWQQLARHEAPSAVIAGPSLLPRRTAAAP
jgi:hypothetical protein